MPLVPARRKAIYPVHCIYPLGEGYGKGKRRIKGKEYSWEDEAYIIDKVYTRQRKRRIKGKEYSWEESCVYAYVPGNLKGKKLLLVPLPQ